MNPSLPLQSSVPARKAPLQRGSLENAKKGKPFRIFDFLWRRMPLILGLSLPVAMVLGLLVTPFASSSYMVTGTLLIKPVKEPMINGGVRDVIQGDVGYFQRTLVLRLSDTEVLRKAIEGIPENKRPKFITDTTDVNRAVFRLMSRLKAREMDRTYLIRVSLEDSESEGLAETLSAVLQSLVDKLKREQERQYESRLAYLHGEREKIAARADEEKTRILKLAGTVENKSFLHEAYTAHLGKMELIQKLYWEAVAVAVDKESLYSKAQADRDKLQEFSLAPFAMERVADNFGINQIEQWTYGKSQDLRSNIDGLTPANPDRKYVEARMASMNDYMERYKKSVSETTIQNLIDKRKFELETEVARTRNAAEAARKGADQLHSQMDQAAAEASKISEAIFQARDLNYGLTQLRERLASINTRIDDAEIEAKSPLPVTIDERPMAPTQPSQSNGSKLRMMMMMAVFGLVGGTCLAFDFFDGRIRSREEFGAAVGGAGAEPVPAITGAGIRLADHSRQHPDHAVSRSLRDLALRIALEQERGGARVVGFAGLHGGAGNTSIALATARAVSEHGLRVLLAEFPTNTPGLAVMAGLTIPAGQPLSATSGKRRKPGATTPAAESGLWGNLQNDPLSSVQLLPWETTMDQGQVRSTVESFVSHATRAYDLVLLDLPPLPESDIAHAAALKSDVAILVGRQDVARFAAARQTVEWLAAGSVPAVTVLLNFESGNALRDQVLRLWSVGQDSVSTLHLVFQERVRATAADLWQKLLEKIAKVKR